MRRPIRLYSLGLLLALALGGYTRLSGLSHGASASNPQSFYHFHPDEETLIRAGLELASPFEPPLTAYGMLPLYVVRAALCLGSTVGGFDLTIDAGGSARSVFLAARVVSAVASCLCLVLLWVVSRRLAGEVAAAVAVWCLALAPVAIQQAHFYTVDGLFTLLSLLVFYASLCSLDSGDRRWYVATGVLIGVTGAVRLNGLLLGLVLLTGRLLQPTADGATRARRMLAVETIAAGAAAVVSLLVLQPYLLTDPARLLSSDSSDDLAFSMSIASGELLRIWGLVDLHTIPFLHYWTHLMPQAVGWPMACALALAVVVSGARVVAGVRARSAPATGLPLLWCALSFAVLGGLQTKHVRYLLPVLPFLAILAGDLLARLLRPDVDRRWRAVTAVIGVAVLLYSGAYGLAFTRLYHGEDSRVAAAGWLTDHVPEHSRVGVEGGGFSMVKLIDPSLFRVSPLGVGALFESRGYLTCGAAATYLHDRVLPLEYIALTDVNRMLPFAAVPELLPAGAGFYRRLVSGRLGFQTAARFKRIPRLAGIEFGHDGPEPAFVGFDHPTTFVFHRTSTDDVNDAFQSWRASLDASRMCADDLIRRAVAAASAGRTREAVQLLEEGESSAQAQLCRVLRQGVRPHGVELSAAGVLGVAHEEQRQQHRIPWALAMSATDLGVPGLSLPVLADAAHRSPALPPWARQAMARSYVYLGELMKRQGFTASAGEVFALSTEIHEKADAYKHLADLAFSRGEHGRAVDFAERSLGVDPAQPLVHAFAAEVAATILGDSVRARRHIERAIKLDPSLRSGLEELVPDR